ncbi:MAG TPA: trans-aconitate 2-methyltransferase [Steroidobacteraceae bacterium]|nr:trans-aconitate 2-methyltransferase [Steroidobacteraceae bacterium]
MTDWNPALYSRFEQERTRAAAELLARVALDQPKHVVDLGCGHGNSTELLARRYPQAHILGLDSSEAMLAAARKRLPAIGFERGEIERWSARAPVDLAFANASLQWVPDHERLVPRLLSAIAPEGALAVQVPDNLAEPSHALMREVAADSRFAASSGAASAVRSRILTAQRYYDLLAGRAAVDVWRTTYYHLMTDAAAIVEWLRSTGLKPFIEPLAPDLRQAYLEEYERRIDAAYPPRADGKRLLAFPRLFFVARRRPN